MKILEISWLVGMFGGLLYVIITLIDQQGRIRKLEHRLYELERKK